jgi:signal transduction histidine kinase/ActR/RegA family two-component response regulator
MADSGSQRPFRGIGLALAAGAATAGLLVVVLVLAADWYRQHLWLVWAPGDLRLFYLAMAVCVGLPGLLVALLVDRQARLRRALAGREDEIARVRETLTHTQRGLVALGAVNHELIRATDRDNLIERICRILVEESGYSLVWVAMVEPGPGGRVRVAGRAGPDAAWIDDLDVRADDSPHGQGPTGRAIREGRPVIVSNMSEEPFFKNWPGLPAELGRYHSALSFPLRRAGRVVGALSIYELSQRQFGDEEVRLLTQMAEDASHGLELLRLAQSRERTSGLLRQALRMGAALSRTALELAAGGQDLRELAGRALRHALWLTGSPCGAVGISTGPTGRLDWLAATLADGTIRFVAPEDCTVYPDDAGRFDGPLAPALNAGLPVLCNRPTELDGYGPPVPGLARVARFLAVPLRREGGVVGLFLVADAVSAYAERDARGVARLAVLFEMAAVRRGIEKDLVAAKRRAEAASEAKTQFLANISHELRTPINGILGMAQLAELEGVAAGQTEYWQTVRDATDRLVEIVDNLLELANVEAGSLSPMLREFSLRRLTESLRGSFSVRAGLAGLAFDLDLDGMLPDRLLGDPFRLRQILSNLIDNAIRFTPAGSVAVRVGRLEAAAAVGQRRVLVSGEFSGVCLLFSISDTGIGIAADKQASIFENFVLAEEPLTKRYGGSGMGLSIARRLAELLGGSIWVESRPEFGSTFHVAVPFWLASPPVAEDEGEARDPVRLPPLRIMVVEDEAVNRLALARGLRKLGHDVIEAGNGEDALRRLSMEAVDVVVMDVQMPVMDGLTAVSHIRNGEVPGTNRRLPVVALTAYALEGDRERFLAAGMDEFVTKPCDMDQLLRAVAKVVTVRPTA